MRCSKACAAEVDIPPFVHAFTVSAWRRGCLPSRPSQPSLQSRHLLLPTCLFGPRLLKSLQLSSNVCYFLFALPTACVQGALRLVDGMLPPLALLLQGQLLPSRARTRSFSKASAAFRSATSSLPRLEGFCALRLCDLRPDLFEPRSPARSEGSSACSLNRPLEPTGRFRTTPDAAMVAAITSGSLTLLRNALVKKVAVGAPGFQSRLHRRRRYRQVEHDVS
jgi:hypothetical protein